MSNQNQEPENPREGSRGINILTVLVIVAMFYLGQIQRVFPYEGSGFWLGVLIGSVLMTKQWSKWFHIVAEWINSLISKISRDSRTEIKRIRAFNKANRKK